MNNKTYKSNIYINRPSGENIIKAEIILNAWLNYCRESRIYRILEWFGFR